MIHKVEIAQCRVWQCCAGATGDKQLCGSLMLTIADASAGNFTGATRLSTLPEAGSMSMRDIGKTSCA